MAFYDSLTDFIFIEGSPAHVDIIFVPGGNYPDAARHAAELYRDGYAPYVMVSGKYSITKGYFEPGQRGFDAGEDGEGENSVREDGTGMDGAGQDSAENGFSSSADCPASDRGGYPSAGAHFVTECEYLSDILLRAGVPETAILREDQATFTYENAIFSRRLADSLGLSVRRAILCCQAFHARRCLLYYQEQFPDTEFLICPVVTKGISRENWHCTPEGIGTVLGEVERCGAQFHEIMKKYMSEC